MNWPYNFLILLCLILPGTRLIQGQPLPYKRYSSDNYRLYNYLMRRYRREVRPVLNAADAILIGVYTYVYQIVRVKQSTNTIVMSACFELFWQDEFLKWDPKDFGGIKEIFFPAKRVWAPEISAYYSVESNRLIQRYNDLRVNYTGGVRYFAPFAVENLCHVNVKYFPFDNQTCIFFFGPWAYRRTEMDWNLLNEEADTTDFYDNQEWQLEQTKLQRVVLAYDYLGQQLNYSGFTLTLFIQRQSFYYIFNLVIPTAIIALVSVVGFHMPGSSSQMRDAKFRLGIMTILSMTMLLLAVVEDMPKFALSTKKRAVGKQGNFSAVPLIGMYYFSLLAIIGLGTVTSSLFVSLERKIRKKEVPWFLCWLSCTFGDILHFPRHMLPKRYRRSKTEPDPAANEISSGYTYTPVSNAASDSVDPFLSTRPNGSIRRKDNLLSTSPWERRHRLLERSATLPGGDNSADAQMLNYIQELTELIGNSLLTIEGHVMGIRKELYAFMPKNMIADRWLVIIERLEWISLIVYVSAVIVVLLMFFFHGWY